LDRVWQPNGPNYTEQEAIHVFEDFQSDFASFGALYDRLENGSAFEIPGLLLRGRQVQRGMAAWTKHDLEEIVRWRRIQSLMSKMDENIELRLTQALRLQDEESRIEDLCRIPGVGPVLASVLLTLTFPERYAPLDNHAWNALFRLGFDLRKRPYSGGGYMAHELFRYTRILRSLAKSMDTLPWNMAKALHAWDKVDTETKWKSEFDLIKLTSSRPVSFGKSHNSRA
jgi:hypothetical protein